MTAQFLTDLITRDDCPKTGRICFTLMQPLVYYSPLLRRKLVIPAGFQTDFLSIPRWLQIAFPPVGRYDYAAVVHDFLTRNGWYSRRITDAVIFEAMSCAIRPKFDAKRMIRTAARIAAEVATRYSIWAGLRVGGWKVYYDYRRAQAARG